jgi:hypothetical protein
VTLPHAKAAIARYTVLPLLSLCLTNAISSKLSEAVMTVTIAAAPSATSQAISEPVATQFYKSLIAGIGVAGGKLSFKLQPGVTITRTTNTQFDIRWIAQAATEAKVSFDYQDGSSEKGWKSLSMEFESQPLTVLFREGRVDKKQYQISRIEFRRNGEPNEYYDQFGSPIGRGFQEIGVHRKSEPLLAPSLF